MTVEHSVPLQLPQAATAVLQTEASLTVGVTADGRIFVEEEPVSRADFHDAWRRSGNGIRM